MLMQPIQELIIAKRPRRNHSPAFKAKVALAAVQGDKTLMELSEDFDIHPNQITQWKNQLLACASKAFKGLPITRANQVCAMDITYIPMARGFVYLTVVMDW